MLRKIHHNKLSIDIVIILKKETVKTNKTYVTVDDQLENFDII